MRRNANASALVYLLLGEFAIRGTLGLLGILYPGHGVRVQQGLIIWGVLAVCVGMALVIRESTKRAMPVIAAIAVLGLSVAVRLPANVTGIDAFAIGIGTWSRLVLPLLYAALFLIHLPSCVSIGESLIRSPRAVALISAALFTTTLTLAYRLAQGYAWAWSPQEPAPYLLMAAFGSAGILSVPRFSLFTLVSILSLKRSAIIGMMGFFIVTFRPRPVITRKTATGALVTIMCAAVIVTLWAGSPVWEAIEHRAIAGVQQFYDVARGSAAETTSLGARLAESDAAVAAWSNSAASVLFGGRLERQHVGPRVVVAVHNTPLSLLHLGGMLYFILLFCVVVPLHRVGNRIRRRQYRWYCGAAMATFIESLAGNALLTLSFGASIAVLISWRQSSKGLPDTTSRELPDILRGAAPGHPK